MKVKIFVDWREEKIITEAQAKEQLAEIKADKDNFQDYKIDFLQDAIEEWLDKHHCTKTFADVFNLAESEKKEILNTLRKWYEDSIESDFHSDWEEIEIEV